MNFTRKMSPDELTRRIGNMYKVQFHEFMKITLTSIEPGRAVITLAPTPAVININKVVHGGIIYSLLDVCGYMAAQPLLHDNQEIVTHEFSSSVLRPVSLTSDLQFHGMVRKMGKRLVFCDSEAVMDGEVYALGRICKSVIDLPEQLQL
jgi:uncharacterized protein (TIGR00369 family)